MIISMLQSIGSKCWPWDCIEVLVFGITLPFGFSKQHSGNKDALVLLIWVNKLVVWIVKVQVVLWGEYILHPIILIINFGCWNMMWLHFICIMVVWRKRKIKELVVWNENKNEKTLEMAKMKRKKKWNDPREGKLRRKWDL